MTQPKHKDPTIQSSPLGGRGAFIPNLFTLINLLLGCLAIVFILQPGETIVQLDDVGAAQVFLPEHIWWGSLCIYAAAVVDFLDGFLARMLKASSEMGKQLDSLSDVVSFGVAPACILYQLLRMGFAQSEGGLDVSFAALLPAFVYAGAVAWRLAKFNISTSQTYSFLGVPSPATGLLLASFPLIIYYQYFNIQSFLINPVFLYLIISVLAYLLTCSRRFLAVKFRDFSFKNNLLKYILLSFALIAVVVLQWLAVPLIFMVYLLVSAFSKEEEPALSAQSATVDITV